LEPIALSIPETGKALGGASRNTIYRMIARKELEAFKLGSRTMITKASIERVVASAPRLVAA
jgi:excisionase family DNA binding protein